MPRGNIYKTHHDIRSVCRVVLSTGCWLIRHERYTGNDPQDFLAWMTPTPAEAARAGRLRRRAWEIKEPGEATSRIRMSCENVFCVAPGHIVAGGQGQRVAWDDSERWNF